MGMGGALGWCGEGMGKEGAPVVCQHPPTCTSPGPPTHPPTHMCPPPLPACC